jgi:D-lactate dehydrogenase (cytochrome)
MNRILAVRPLDFLATAQPGVTRNALNHRLRHDGLFFPVDPGADATLGGMAATNASGTTTVRYGGMRQNMVALQVALADGRLIRLGRPVRKTSSGYDLRDLFVGSAGTLGVITEVTVALHPQPAHVHAVRVFFPTVPAAVATAYQLMAGAVEVARLELVDALSIRAIDRHLGRDYPQLPALFIELHAASAVAIEAALAEIRQIAGDNGALELSAAGDPAERAALWEARHQLYWAIKGLYPGRTYLITDAAVPLSAVAELVDHTVRQAAELALDVVVAGHVADGNVHTVVAVREEDRARAGTFADRLVERSLALGGTATGEHGIGLAKRKYLRAEHGAAVDVMAAIKQVLDPLGILNPGKVLAAGITHDLAVEAGVR